MSEPDSAPSHDGQPVLPRRAALVALGAVALGGAAGCAGADSAVSHPPPPAHTSQALSPDVRTAVGLVERYQKALAQLEGAGKGDRKLRRELRPLGRVQQEHLRTLRRAVPPAQARLLERNQPRARKATTRQHALAGTGRLREELLDSAVRAESGPFARMLASMAAALGQQMFELGVTA